MVVPCSQVLLGDLGEAEEEEGLPPVRPAVMEDEDDAVEHASLKPTWLLKMFNYWGSRWGSAKGGDAKAKEGSKERQEQSRDRAGSAGASGATTGVELRSAMVRNYTT